MRGVDYDSQEELINELHEALQLDPDGGSKVEHYCTIYNGLLPIEKLRGLKYFLFVAQHR